MTVVVLAVLVVFVASFAPVMVGAVMFLVLAATALGRHGSPSPRTGLWWLPW